MTQYSWNVHSGAHKHGLSLERIDHALRHPITVVDLESDDHRRKLLFIGSDQSGNFLELIALVLGDDGLLVIHAMPLRPRFQRLLSR